jgi:CRISPR-associated protein Cmr5
MNSAKKSDLNRTRMKDALDKIQAISKQGNGDLAQKYRALVRKFPLLLRTHGLGSSFAFLASKGNQKEAEVDNEHDLLAKHLLSWLDGQSFGAPDLHHRPKDKASQQSLAWETILGKIADLENTHVLLLRRELLAYLTWLKRLAEASIEAPKSEIV